jgi:hypothetical protein
LRGQKRRRDGIDDHIEEKESRYGISIHIYAVRRQCNITYETFDFTSVPVKGEMT